MSGGFIWETLTVIAIVALGFSGVVHIFDGDVTNGLLMLILAAVIDGGKSG